MENVTKQKEDCGCEGDCCPPKSKPKWIKYLSILVLLTALAIVGFKVVKDKGAPAPQCTSAAGKSCCADSSKTASCDTTKNASCCSKSGK